MLVTGTFLFHWLATTLCKKKYQHFQHSDVLGKQYTDLLNVYYYNSDKDVTDAMMLISEKLFTQSSPEWLFQITTARRPFSQAHNSP